MINLFTIGFTKKPAETFFQLLNDSGINQIVDTRINNVSQLSGFAKGPDLQFFARQISNVSYVHNTDLAPTKAILSLYRSKKLTWNEYETEYLNLLDIRKIAQKINVENLHQTCLLCSEHKPDNCHRRLLAEYFKQVRNDIQITHLI